MTEQEKLMYKILAQISDSDTPIIFKGGLITKLILEEQGFTDITRMTKDIDANWIDNPPSMHFLVDTINRSLGELQHQYFAEISREYGVGKSAGVSIIEKERGIKIISMDIDIKPLIGSKIYYFGEAGIKGVLANEILADKICAISSDSVYKHRAKDIIDVYSLSHCTEVNIKDIYQVCQKVGRQIQSFDAFYNRKSDVEHAYNRLARIDGKPLFSVIYEYLTLFVKPFAEKNFEDKIWDATKTSWKENSDIITKNTTFFISRKTIYDNAKKIKQERTDNQSKRKHKAKNSSIGDD